VARRRGYAERLCPCHVGRWRSVHGRQAAQKGAPAHGGYACARQLGDVLVNIEPHLLALRWFVGGRMRQPRMTVGSSIAGSQDFIPGVGARFQLSRDFANDCRT
jgi:hypothetical protein